MISTRRSQIFISSPWNKAVNTTHMEEFAAADIEYTPPVLASIDKHLRFEQAETLMLPLPPAAVATLCHSSIYECNALGPRPP